MRHFLFAVCALVVLSSPSAFAASGAELAREIAAMSLTKETWDDMMEKVAEDTEAALLAQMQGDEQEHREMSKVFRQAMKEMSLPYEDIIDLQMSILVKYYDASELAELKAFYKTALGKKMIRVLPEMTRDVSAAINQKIHSRMNDVMHKVATQARKMGARQAAPNKAQQPAAPRK